MALTGNMWKEIKYIQIIHEMHENLNISDNLLAKSKTLKMVNQEIRWILLAKLVLFKKSHASVPLSLNSAGGLT